MKLYRITQLCNRLWFQDIFVSQTFQTENDPTCISESGTT